jgi:hypothetical protein
MTNHGSLSISRAAAIFFILGALACVLGAVMYVQGSGSFERGQTFHAWERGFFIAAVILTAIGFLLLEDIFHASNGRALARIGASGYFFAAVLLVSGEVLAFTLGWEKASVLIPIYVVMAYLAEASVGGALLQSRIMAPGLDGQPSFGTWHGCWCSFSPAGPSATFPWCITSCRL